MFARPLKLDLPTCNLTRPSAARILVEMDITCNQANEVWIGTQTNVYWQTVEIESKSYYCKHCSMFGHTLERCYAANPQLRPPNQLLPKNNILTESQTLQPNLDPTPSHLPTTVPFQHTELDTTLNQTIHPQPVATPTTNSPKITTTHHYPIHQTDHPSLHASTSTALGTNTNQTQFESVEKQNNQPPKTNTPLTNDRHNPTESTQDLTLADHSNDPTKEEANE